MQVFYVNVGGGEPTVRPDFWHLLDYAIGHDVGVKFSTNGIKLDRTRAAQLARTDYVDVQISLDGATAEVNDHVRGPGSYDTAITAMKHLHAAGMRDFKLSVVMTRENVSQLAGSPESKPLSNQVRRCSDVPWVKLSGFTRRPASRASRSSPTASVAVKASSMSPGSMMFLLSWV